MQMNNFTQAIRVILLGIMLLGSVYVFTQLGLVGTLLVAATVGAGYTYEKLLPKVDDDVR